METTIGGDRLGSGNKQQVSYKNYERSTHDLSYLWRSTMSSGTLVPFMSKLALPGDSWDIELNTEVLTLPTVGPLFGSYKVQLDVFEIPIRLYNAKLHMNKLGIGMDMKNILLPQIELRTNNHSLYKPTYEDNEQIDPSCILKYLGISGLGHMNGSSPIGYRYFNAVPLLAYWDIYKNYYSNKQEEIGMYIHTPGIATPGQTTPTSATITQNGTETNFFLIANSKEVHAGEKVTISFGYTFTEPDQATLATCHIDDEDLTITSLLENITWDSNLNKLTGYIKDECTNLTAYILDTPWNTGSGESKPFGIYSFPLSNIDDIRTAILQYTLSDAFLIDNTMSAPYNIIEQIGQDENAKFSYQFSQEGLGLKTYQSDLFNNWINTEWIDGENGVSELSKVLLDTSGPNEGFTIDALNIATKVYNMLNRIAISGGTYDDWLDAVYTHERVKAIESPVYLGSLIKELAFQEVISNAQTNEQPLGTLAGRGVLTNKHKGGKIYVKVNEPSYIMGIVSLTPRIEYSQGNEWDMNLKSFDDFHKPALDAIGFQDLITDQLLWSDTNVESSTGALTTKSLGKQPAWVNYMTSVNKTFGNFAKPDDSMFMTLNRRYSKNNDGSLSDPTTYIDPTKFNNIFAETSLDSQNFWVQIACNITARRKMSAKLIPNL